jgi:hypothetical protein
MTAIPAASVGVKTMADGTLRITFDIEPSEAGAAFALFGKPGTPAALAALQVGYAAATEVTTEVKPKGGPLSQAAAMLDHNEAFYKYALARDFTSVKELILNRCIVDSRKELDHDKAAANRFHEMMREFNAERATA